MVVGVHSRGGVGLAVPVVLVAGRHMIGCSIVGTDVKVQGVCAGTAVRIGIAVCVYTALCIFHPMPCVRVTGTLGIAGVGAIVDCQVQSHHAVTPRCIGLCKLGFCRAGGICHSMPRVFITSRLYINTCVAVVNGQIQCHHTVTSCCIGLCIGRCCGR